MARPTKKTPTVQERIVAAIKLGATYQRAAAAGGITYETLRCWLRDGEQADSEFSAFFVAVREAEAYATQTALQSIQRAARGGQWQAATWFLEHRYSQEYGKQVMTHEHSGPGGQPLTIAIQFDAAAAFAAVTSGSATDRASAPDA